MDMRKFNLILMMLLMLVTANSWAGVKAYLNQTTVYEGDLVTLTIESDSSSTIDPDLSVLNKDFQIQGTSQGSSARFSFGNNQSNASHKKTWTIQLAPKRKGQIEIPVIRLGNESTMPLILTVADLTTDIISKNSQHVTLEASVGIGQSLPYVQQQIPYVIKLYTDETITSGELFAPNIEHAVVEKLSKDKQKTIVRNGKKLNVLERHYVISPEKSGKLIIPPAIFKGKQVLPNVNSKQRSPGNSFADDFFNDPLFNGSFFGSAFDNPFRPSGTAITTRSDSIEIEVQPIPAEYKGANWLPAEDLVVIDNWDDSRGKSNPVFKVGEPVVRTLTLQTKGLAGPQIPEFSVATPQKIRVYPDKASSETKTDGNTVFGSRQQSMSYIPNAAGKVIIPAVKIDWWNVVTKTQESFTLPEQEIQILPGVGGSEQQANVVDTGNAVKEEQSQQGDTLSEDRHDNLRDEETQSPAVEPSSSNKWLWGLLLLGAISVFIFLQRRKKQLDLLPASSDPTKQRLNRSHLFNELQQACNDNNRTLTAKLLLEISELEWPNSPPKNLGTLADRVENKNGSELIRALDKSLYADRRTNDGEAWEGCDLWEVVKVGLRSTSSKKSSANEAVAASLYPDRSA